MEREGKKRTRGERENLRMKLFSYLRRKVINYTLNIVGKKLETGPNFVIRNCLDSVLVILLFS